MKPEPINLGKFGNLGRWGTVGAVGLLAVVLGVLWPHVIADAAPAPPPAVRGNVAGGLEYQPPALPEAPDPKALLIRFCLGSLVVLGLSAGGLYAARRWVGGKQLPAGSGQQLRLIETLSLGQRCCVHLVQVDRRQVLVGVDFSGMRTIVPLPESFDAALAEDGAASDGRAAPAALPGDRPWTP
jgi:flagellar biogenesis protein FliO